MPTPFETGTALGSMTYVPNKDLARFFQLEGEVRRARDSMIVTRREVSRTEEGERGDAEERFRSCESRLQDLQRSLAEVRQKVLRDAERQMAKDGCGGGNEG